MDYYELLGVSRNATPKEIKDAFRKLAKKYHPDFCGDTFECRYRFEEVIKAYKVLSDPAKRDEYDSALGLRAKWEGAGAVKKEVIETAAFTKYLQHGKSLERAGKLKEAEKYYRKAVAVQQNSVEANYRLGCCLGNQDKFYDAYFYLQRAIKLEPKNGLLWCAYGQCLEREGKLIGAEQAYRLALELSPNKFEILYSLGACLLAQCKQWDVVAESEFYTTLGRDGALEWKRRTWKMVIKEAEYYLELAFLKNPTSFEVNYKLGKCYLEQGLIEKASQKFHIALKIKPDSKLPRKGLAECQRKFFEQLLPPIKTK